VNVSQPLPTHPLDFWKNSKFKTKRKYKKVKVKFSPLQALEALRVVRG
jgi:hypothetical protein